MVRNSRNAGDDDDAKPPAIPAARGRRGAKKTATAKGNKKSGREAGSIAERVPDTHAPSPPNHHHDNLTAAKTKAAYGTSNEGIFATTPSSPAASTAAAAGHAAAASSQHVHRAEYTDTKYLEDAAFLPTTPGKEEIDASNSVLLYPGAVPIDGPRLAGAHHASLSSDRSSTVQGTHQDLSPAQLQDQQDMAIAAEVVAEDVDVEAQVHSRMREEADQIAERVRQTLIQEAVQADVMEEESPSEKQNVSTWSQSKKWWVVIGTLAILLVVVVVVLIVVFTTRDNGGGTDATGTVTDAPIGPSTPTTSSTPSPTTAAQTLPPTLPPTNPPVQPTRLSLLQERLTPVVGEVFSDETGPQFAALQWLANEDPATLPVETTALSILKNRFIVATLYFATNGESWTNQYNFRSAADICEWNAGSSNDGITCDNEDLGVAIRLGK